MNGRSLDKGASEFLSSQVHNFSTDRFRHIENEDTPLSRLSLETLLPHSLMSTPIASVQDTDKMWVVTAMLCRYLESFTDAVIVMKNDEPLGVLGGMETLAGILRNPKLEFFEDVTAGKVMTEHVEIVSKKMILGDLITLMQRQRFGIAIVPYSDKGYASISVRTLLEIAALSKSDMRVSELPKRSTVTIDKDCTIKDAIITMLQYQTRKLIFEDSSTFLSDRGIIEKIAMDLKYLENVSDFSNKPANRFNPKLLQKIDDDLTIPTMSKIMLDMDVPYVLNKDQVITPWDIAMLLG